MLFQEKKYAIENNKIAIIKGFLELSELNSNGLHIKYSRSCFTTISNKFIIADLKFYVCYFSDKTVFAVYSPTLESPF